MAESQKVGDNVESEEKEVEADVEQVVDPNAKPAAGDKVEIYHTRQSEGKKGETLLLGQGYVQAVSIRIAFMLM